MDKRSSLSLRYEGVTPDAMEARELIQVLAAFNRISLKASQAFYGGEAQTSFRIARVQPGSVYIDGLIELAAGLQPGFAMLPSLSLGMNDVPTLIKQWLDLLKFLRGQPPRRIQKVNNGNAVQIENSTGKVTTINGNVYNSCIFFNVGRDASRLDAPTKHGAKTLELARGKRRLATYSAAEVKDFAPIRPNDAKIESEIEAMVEVISPVLDGDGMWRFRYGQMRFPAKLIDEDYMEKVASGTESFRHGDRLRVKLKTTQESVGDKISTKYFITKVENRL